ncbi:14-3-3 protein [Podila epicladia]|nr:14-3-3 protein [Podila epicladia]
MVDDLTAATPSNDKDPKHALGTTDPYTMTTEHAELYQKLIRDLIETVPTNDKVIETAQCRMLMATYDDDLLARHKAYDPWGCIKTIKNSDDAMIAQLSTDIIDRLENILHNATDTVSIVFYNIMKGNYYRHMAKYLTNHDKHKKTIYQDQALSTFTIAKKSATSSSMSLNDPIYLELHISLANLYYLMGMYRSARITNAWAYDASCECKDQLDEEDSKLSASINERMRKLMNRWTDEAIMGLTY